MMDKTEDAVKETIGKFNKYRAPEAIAKFVSINKGSVRIEFTGPFCQTCGRHDYFDDFRLMLEEKEVESEIGEIRELGNGGNLVEFVVIEKS